jgi:hypothetical protein
VIKTEGLQHLLIIPESTLGGCEEMGYVLEPPGIMYHFLHSEALGGVRLRMWLTDELAAVEGKRRRL